MRIRYGFDIELSFFLSQPRSSQSWMCTHRASLT